MLAELELPADQIRAVRLVAGRIALAEGLDEESAEDVKLAVGEAVTRLAEADDAARLRVLFRRLPATLSVEFPGFPGSPPTPGEVSGDAADDASDRDFGWLILSAVVPTLGMAGDTLHLAWPLPQATVTSR